MAEYGRYISMFQEDKIMDLIEYLQDKNLLPRQRACVNCNDHPMNIQKFKDSPDGITFRCTKCKSRISLQKNTFFVNYFYKGGPYSLPTPISFLFYSSA